MGNVGSVVELADYTEQIKDQKKEYEELINADNEVGTMLQEMMDSVHTQKGQNEENEAEAERKIQQYLAAHNGGKAGNEYLVRGAELKCTCGSNQRKLNLDVCHGVYIRGHAVVHELDCIQGDKENITWFGACEKEELNTESIIAVGDDGQKHAGKKCKPHIIGVWMDSYDGTKIVDNGNKMADDFQNPVGCNTLTVGSFLVCKYGGIIAPISSGQEREVSESEFVEGKDAYNRVMEFEPETVQEESDGLLSAKADEEKNGEVVAEQEDTQEKEYIGRYPVEYIDKIIKSYERHKMVDGKFVVDGGAIAFGHDVVSGEDFSEGLTEEEGLNLAIQDLDAKYEQIERLIKTLNQSYEKDIHIENFTENEILFLVDFAYNRGMGLVERPELKEQHEPYSSLAILIVAVSEGNDAVIVQTLQEETRNTQGVYYSGLELRRMDEYEILKYGDFERDYDITRGVW